MTTSHELGAAGGAYDVPPPRVRASATRILTLSQLLDRRPEPFLVRHVIRQGDFVVLYAPASAGKTFIAIGIALAIASGCDWFGHRTTLGPVLYLAGEGGHGLGMRCRAWAKDSAGGLDSVASTFFVLPEAVPLLDDAEFERLCVEIKAMTPPPVAVFIDTLARAMDGGDENKAQDMGRFVGRCDAIRKLTGASVIVVHHTAKGSLEERGSSALRGAADVMLTIEREHESLDLILRGAKSKDSEPLPPLYLALERVEIGVDDEGEAITSMVVRRREQPDDSPREVASRDPGRAIREALASVLGGEASGTLLQGASGVPRSSFYRVLHAEIDAHRIVVLGSGRRLSYRLTDVAPEYVGLSLSLTESQDVSETDEESSVAQSQSQSHRPPKGGAGVRLGQDAASERTERKPRASRNRKAAPETLGSTPNGQPSDSRGERSLDGGSR